jgi:lipopolysaccharide/colanic/teichoic acid biosynthesis glycosyltransferase
MTIKQPRVGYVKASRLLYRLFTIVFSSLFLVATSPLLLFVSLAILALDGWPILYVGTRLGMGKKLFHMFKFRTLVRDADKHIGANLFRYSLETNRSLLTRTGKFLRETRIDEIPQFINTLKGDMDLLGPRPIRPEQYDLLCRNIPGFDIQFTVRPGLIGYSQLFTPHSSPKRIRSLFDHQFILKKHRYSLELVLVISSLFLIGIKLLEYIVKCITSAANAGVNRRKEQRALARVSPEGVMVYIRPGTAALPEGRLDLEIRVPKYRLRLKRKLLKTIRCSGNVYYVKAAAGGKDNNYVIKCLPTSNFNYYLMHQYLMQGSVLPH